MEQKGAGHVSDDPTPGEEALAGDGVPGAGHL